MEESIESTCGRLRSELKEIEVSARALKEKGEIKNAEQSYQGQHGEMIAQSMLAVRAIEEARMRLGKVLQYAGDGVSIYDKA